MDDRSLRILEIHKVREMLASMAGWALGKEKALGLRVFRTSPEIMRAQDETAEARAFLDVHPGWRMGGVRDIRAAVGRAARGAVLDVAELQDVASTSLASRRIGGYLEEHAKEQGILRGLAMDLGFFQGLPEEISRCISQEGSVKDEASPELGRARSQMKTLSGRLKDRLDDMVRSPAISRYLQDPIVTIREGRYVIPVKQEYRGSVPGLIHDQSSSGATLFIEPEACVALNNEIRRLELREKEEVLRVLQGLSQRVSGFHEGLKDTLESLGQLDFAFAKAHLAGKMEALRPAHTGKPLVRLFGARHPLLADDAVPIDVRVGEDFDVLVITGPNTGGKTVSLKTVGLLCLMYQAGLQIPARDGSVLGIFEDILCDIGDEQSIEQSLSTFSSHMVNIARFVKEAKSGSLILMDEMGAGTDPAEGSSLAMAILEDLAATGAKVIATTHYSELKAFAFKKPRVENAAMEFDPATLRPTFRLIMGLPGRSNAFEIAERLGLPGRVVEVARSHLGAKQTHADSLIRRIEEDSLRLEKESQMAREARADASRLADEARRELERVEVQRETILAKAREQADDLLRRTGREVRQVLKDLRKVQKTAVLTGVEQGRERLEGLRKDLEVDPSPEPGEPPGHVDVGDSVFLPSAGVQGRVLSPPDQDGKVLVEAGAVRVRLPLSELRAAREVAAEVTRERVGSMMAAKSQSISPEVDLRGLTAEEALSKLDKYLDDAGLAGVGQVRVIHGKGTGVLKRAVNSYLAEHPQVASFRQGVPGEGGDGVAIVKMS